MRPTWPHCDLKYRMPQRYVKGIEAIVERFPTVKPSSIEGLLFKELDAGDGNRLDDFPDISELKKVLSSIRRRNAKKRKVEVDGADNVEADKDGKRQRKK